MYVCDDNGNDDDDGDDDGRLWFLLVVVVFSVPAYNEKKYELFSPKYSHRLKTSAFSLFTILLFFLSPCLLLPPHTHFSVTD